MTARRPSDTPPQRGAEGGRVTSRPAPDDTAVDQRERLPALLVLTIMLIGMFAFVQVYSVQSILPELRLDLHATVVQIGNAVGATVLAIALVSPVMGMLSDALGRRWIILGSIFLLAIPTALMTQVQTIDGLLVLRFLQGLAVPGVSVVAIAYVGEEFRGATMLRVMAMYISGTVMGGFLGRFLMGHLTEVMSWRAAFGVMAALNVAGGLLVWRVLPASRNFRANARFRAELRTLASLLHNPAVQAPCALGFTILFALVGVFTFVNLHLAAAPYHFNAAQLANVFAVYLVGILVTPLVGRIMPRFGPRRVLLVSVAVSALGVALTLVRPAAGIVAALTLASSGVFVTQAAVTSFIAQRVTSGRSLASGLYYTAYYVGGFTGAWVCGIAYTHGGWPATVAVMLLVEALGWTIAWRYVR